MGDRAIEVKVGLLLLVAMVLLGGFLLVMSGLRLEKSYKVYVNFNNPGGVQSGAPVKIAGERVGTVKSATYLGGRLDPRTGKRKLVRLEIAIDERVRETVHDDAIFYVATQGVLGEQFVAIDPGTWEVRDSNGRTRPRALLRDGAVVEGVDPPRLDLALALGYELLETMTRTLRENRQLLSQLLDDTASMLRSISTLLRDNRGRFNQIIANVNSLITELDTTVRHTRERVIDSPHTTQILSSLDHTLREVRREVGPLMREGRETLGNVDTVIDETLGPEQRGQIRGTLADVRTIAQRADRMTNDAQEIVTHIRQGRGTVGALLMDEEVYDDLQELVRDLKHNPWKFFWRESRSLGPSNGRLHPARESPRRIGARCGSRSIGSSSRGPLTLRITEDARGVTFEVRVVPRASRTGAVGDIDGALKVAIAAPPVDGAANEALVAWLADVLDVPKQSVVIVRGETGRSKVVRVAGVTRAAVEALAGE